MHPKFTRIPQRSYKAFVPGRKVELDALLAALAVDPLEAEDAFKLFGVGGIPHSLENFADRGRGAYRQALETISQWVTSRRSADSAIREIAQYDRRLGVWCAAQLARTVLRAVPKGEGRPLIAVETAERWVIGEATAQQCRDAASSSAAAAADMPFRSAQSSTHAAYAAARAAKTAVEHQSFASGTASSAAYAADMAAYYMDKSPSLSQAEFKALRIADGRRLLEALADACLSYPVLP